MTADLGGTITQLAWLAAEAVLVSVILLTLFRARPWFGHTMLYLTLGAFQYLQTVLATSTYVELFPGIGVSPGSAVLFSGSLFVILLVYILEDLEQTRRLIYSMVVANAIISLISIVFGLHITLTAPGGLPEGPAALFGNARVMIIGTLVLYLDVILTVLLYEVVCRVVRFSYLRILITMSCVLTLDTVLFFSASFAGNPQMGQLIVSGIAGKICAAVFCSMVLTVYLHRVEDRGGSLGGGGSLADVFRTLTYRQRFEQLREQMHRDGLTGVFNRAFFDEALPHQIALAARQGNLVGLLMVDLDHFKRINDEFGHQVGDRVLIAAAQALANSVRQSDLVCRYGGEEFAVICPHVSPEQGRLIGDKLLQALARLDFAELGIDREISATIGAAVYPDDAADAEQLIRHADRRLYQGKRSGRNRVVGRS